MTDIDELAFLRLISIPTRLRKLPEMGLKFQNFMKALPLGNGCLIYCFEIILCEYQLLNIKETISARFSMVLALLDFTAFSPFPLICLTW